MPTPTPSPSRTTTAPQPVSPTGGRGVEGHSAEFSWTSVDDAASYRLQIAPEADFASPYFDAVVDAHTQLTVVDALPTDGSTCYWRVRVEAADAEAAGADPSEATSSDAAASDWSGTAHFTARPDAVTETLREASGAMASAAHVPTPTSPTDEAPTDGRAAVFTWEPVPDALRYELQVAPSDAFEAPVVTVPLDDTTHLTLYDLLPEDGSTFFWRVRAVGAGADASPWSAPAALTAATDEDVIAYEAQQEREAADALERADAEAVATAAERAEAESPVLTARSSAALTTGIAIIMVASFIVTILLIYRAV